MFKYVFLFCALAFMGSSCRQPVPKDDAVGVDQLQLDTLLFKISDSDVLYVTPGENLGKFTLRSEVDDSLFAALGRADSVDAAMCKSWSIWYWDGKNKELDLYMVCDPSQDMRKTLKIVRTKGFDFKIRHATETLDQDSELAVLKSAFPTGTVISSPGKSSSTLYQVAKKGIAFELNSDSAIVSVLVFPKGETLEEQYIPFY